jgi:hypothetical protein
MLTNGFYAGRLKWKELDVRGSHPPLVSSDLYAKVAKVLSTRYRDAGVKGSVTGFPLRGLAICSTCRSRMTAERHGQWGYYRCGRNAFQSAACRAKFCNATRAHRDLEGICQQIRITQDARNAILKTLDRLIRDRVSSAERSQRHLENQETALIRDELRLTEAFTSGDMSPDVYKVRSADLRLRRTRLASDRARGLPDPVQLTAKAARILDVATSLRDFHDTFSNDERASLFRDVFSTIVISSEGIVGYTLRKPFNELVSSAKNDPRKLSVEKRERLAKAILNAA